MLSAQLQHVTEFKYVGSTLKSDGDMGTEVNKSNSLWMVWMEQLDEDVRCPMR